MKKKLISDELKNQNLFWGENPASFFLELEHISQKRDLFNKIVDFLEERQIISVVGLRRVGKTILMKQLVKKLLDQGVKRENIMFLSFDEALISKNVQLRDYLEVYLKDLLPKDSLDKNERIYFFIDEIQYIDKWQHILKRYYDRHYNFKFIVTGSSSLFLKKKTTESLVGRIFEFFLSPLSFKEFLLFSSEARNNELSQEFDNNLIDAKRLLKVNNEEVLEFLNKSKSREIERLLAWHSDSINRYFEKYLSLGQFPEVVKKKDKFKVNFYTRESVYKKSLEYDIPRIFGVEKVQQLKFVFDILVNETGNLIELNNLSSEAEISTKTLKKYLGYFEEGLLADILYNYSKSFRKSKRKEKKIYVASSNFFPFDWGAGPMVQAKLRGHLAETHVYNLLKQKFEYLAFYRERKQEIDFVVADSSFSKENLSFVEVKYRDKIDPRMFKFLKRTHQKFNCQKPYIILTKDQFFVEEDENGQVGIGLPLFLLK